MTQVAPAQLFIVSQPQTEQVVCSYLQNIFCKQDENNAATISKLITEKRHHSVLWIEPEKRYTLDLLDGIFKKTELSLEPGQQYFFVLKKADFLTPACANSLLKIVEEPPPGYHFIFTAQRKQLVLPTIRSRCVLQTFSSDQPAQTAVAFSSHFMSFTTDPHAFLKEVSTTQLTEVESRELLDIFLDYWCTHYKKALTQNNEAQAEKSSAMIALFEEALQAPPMPGSSKIFWRNLFLKKSLV